MTTSNFKVSDYTIEPIGGLVPLIAIMQGRAIVAQEIVGVSNWKIPGLLNDHPEFGFSIYGTSVDEVQELFVLDDGSILMSFSASRFVDSFNSPRAIPTQFYLLVPKEKDSPCPKNS